MTAFVLLSSPARERELAEITDLLRSEPHRAARRSPTEITEEFRSAARVVRAVDTADDRLLGVGWILSDGLGSGYLADVFVDPEHRQEGIGRAISRELGRTPTIGCPTWSVGHERGLTVPRPSGDPAPDGALTEGREHVLQ